MDGMKECSKCHADVSVDDFYGKLSYCKTCRKKQAAEYARANQAIIREKRKEYDLKNKEKLAAYKQAWYKAHADEIIARSCKRQELHKDSIAAYKKQWHKSTLNRTRKRRSETSKAYKKRNKHIVLWRSLLERWLKSTGKKKSFKTETLLGYSAQELRLHLESLWTQDMCWNNYGEWHVDHIKPLSSFPTTSEPCEVNALSNLRPLWATSRVINGITYEGNLNRART